MTIEESYKVLKLKRSATETEIRTAYKKLIKHYHPDTFRGNKEVATNKTMQINQAYRILTFKEKPTPSKKKHKFFNIFSFIKNQRRKKQKQKQERIEALKQEKEDKKRLKQQKKEEKRLENQIPPEIIIIGIMAIILIFLVVWFLAAGR